MEGCTVERERTHDKTEGRGVVGRGHASLLTIVDAWHSHFYFGRGRLRDRREDREGGGPQEVVRLAVRAESRRGGP
jgi:hypothetical protein